ncbi:MAG: hypothetical protein M0000_01760 [Actinomycetota bacterium]|nr:hypothetical protein [Actinomycetota bacterium]
MKVGAVQLVQVPGDYESNMARALAGAESLMREGCRLVVLPEMFATGYLFASPEEAAPFAQPAMGETFHSIHALCLRYGAVAVYGYMEHDPATDTLHNAAAAVGPEGLLARYRKVHPFVADTTWAVDGNELGPYFEIDGLVATVAICADIEFPETAARRRHYDILCLPTAWVEEKAPSFVWLGRAREAGCYLVAADLAGVEAGANFSGGSCVISPEGKVLASLDAGDGVVSAEISPAPERRGTRIPAGLQLSLQAFEPAELAVRAPVAIPRQQDLHFDLAALRLEDYSCSPEGIARVESLLAANLSGPSASGTLLVALPLADRTGRLAEGLLVGAAKSFAEQLGYDEVLLGQVLRGRQGPERLIASSAWSETRSRGSATTSTGLRLELLTGEELDDWIPCRRAALSGASVALVSADTASARSPEPRAPSAISLPPFGDRPQMDTVNRSRLRAGENNIAIAISVSGAPMPLEEAGVYGPDMLAYPFYETVAPGTDWAARLAFGPQSAPQATEALARRPYLRQRKPWLYTG